MRTRLIKQRLPKKLKIYKGDREQDLYLRVNHYTVEVGGLFKKLL